MSKRMRENMGESDGRSVGESLEVRMGKSAKGSVAIGVGPVLK